MQVSLPSGADQLNKLLADTDELADMQAMIELLAEDARPPAAKKLTARPEWRVRSGDYRVDAGHRCEVYR